MVGARMMGETAERLKAGERTTFLGSLWERRKGWRNNLREERFEALEMKVETWQGRKVGRMLSHRQRKDEIYSPVQIYKHRFRG